MSVVAPPTRSSTRVLGITGFDDVVSVTPHGGRGGGEVGRSGTGGVGLTSG
jgi:hypothetical protein